MIFSHVRRDFDAISVFDPASKNKLEDALCSPGFHAVTVHRFSHRLHVWGVPLLPRLVSQLMRFITGAEIHPGAKIKGGLFIDHAMGVVIGETTEIGENVLLYQGVTLGGTGKHKGKRHPTIGNNVVVGVGASILGPITIGDNVRVGAGSVVVKDVPPDSTVVGVPGEIIRHKGVRVQGTKLEHGELPDPLFEMIRSLRKRVDDLEKELRKKKAATRS
ncbi:serine O-acetyltransferase [Candidatus Micrarchaeota archaeon]|nr:serine O-acetyltransferase [Candidatus Micrarchaeota archaeon]